MGGLSFHTSLFTDYSVEETLVILERLGFHGIELNLETSPDFTAHITPDVSPERRAEILAAIDRSPINLSSLSPKCDMIPADEQKRRQALEYVMGSIDLAAAMDTDIVHIASGWITEEAGIETCWQWIVDSVRSCIEYGREQGVRIGMEAGIFPGLIVWNTATMLELIDRVGYDDLYVNFDPSHLQCAGDDVVESFRTLHRRIINIHAKDGRNGGSRDQFEFPALGDGDVDWNGLVKAMLDTQYDGYVAVEYEAHFFSKNYAKDPLGAAQQSKTFLDNVMGEWVSWVRK